LNLFHPLGLHSTVSEITNSVFGRLVIIDFVGVSHRDVSTQLVKKEL